MVFNIIKIGDERLRKMSENVDVFDFDLEKLIKNMQATLKKAGGVGLAAPQVGVNKRVVLIKPQKDVYVLINPKYISKGKEMICGEEGCLSVPGEWIEVDRHKDIEIEFCDVKGDLYRVKAQDLFARIIQHEIDHLDGKLIVDYK